MFISPFRERTYNAERPKMVQMCHDQYVAFLQKKYPEDDPEKIKAFVTRKLKSSMRVPTVDITRQTSIGNFIREQIPLSLHLIRDVANRIISPSGSVYKLPTEHESFLRITIGSKKAERSRHKKIMLKYKEEGDNLQESIANYLQSSAKVTNNSFAGALNSPYNILYCKPNFAATTSISRQSVKCGYSHIELFLGGNIFITSYDDVVNYCLRQIEEADLQVIEHVVEKYGLTIPSAEDVHTFFMDAISNYVFIPPEHLIRAFIGTLSRAERCAVYYTGCFKHLLTLNGELFKPYFRNMFDVSDVEPYTGDDLKGMLKGDGDVRMMVQSLHYQVLGQDEEGRNLNPQKAYEVNQEGLRQFIGIEQHFVTYINQMREVFETFLRPKTDVARMHEHPAMVRTNTLISDTDSAIFTTQNIVEWYAGRISFDPEAFAINAFAVFSVVKSLEHRFARLSCGFGMVGDDIYGINMKNEFFMVALMRANIKKTYASLNLFQEGKILPTPKLDIKGVQLRDSKLSPNTVKETESFISDLFKDVLKEGSISGFDYLRRVRRFELEIYQSIMRGERTYLKTDPIKDPSEYEKDPMSSSYFYYDLWTKVFTPEYDSITIPTKCYVLPLKMNGKILNDPHWLEMLRKESPSVHRKLLDYMAELKKSKRTVSRLMLPPSIASIPEVLKPVMNIREIIYTNCKPLYLCLQAIGFAYNYGPDQFLVADFFEADKDFSIPYS